MIQKSFLLWSGGLVLGLIMMIFVSLALAHQSMPLVNMSACEDIICDDVAKRDIVRSQVEQSVNHSTKIELTQRQVVERTEAQLPFADPLPRITSTNWRYQAAQPIRREFAHVNTQVVNKVYRIRPSISVLDSVNAITQPMAECVVNSAQDDGSGTLRWCLENVAAGDTITFDANVFPPTNPVTISLLSELPWIATDRLIIDASEAGVILDGSGLLSGTGFVIWGADGVKIRGLQILHFPQDGIALAGGTTNTTIGGNRFIGDGLLGQGNLISGNGRVGIWFQDTETMSNTVIGNNIGTDISGKATLANKLFGVLIGFGATNNTIGGNTLEARNLISGNGDSGIQIQNAETFGNRVIGNYIGTNVSGTAPLANGYIGVLIISGPTHNTIGGNTSGTGNLISGNGHIGIELEGSGTMSNTVLGNYVGVNVSSTAALANTYFGILIRDSASGNIIGGRSQESHNIISGNGLEGIWIVDPGTSGNSVVGNYIGTDASGTKALGNLRTGIFIGFGASDNLVGGSISGTHNLISGNREHGIQLQGPGTTGNLIQGNYIGTDISGSVAIGNLGDGVLIMSGASNNIVGGSTSGEGNLISGNESEGIRLQGSDTTGNQIQGNFIGTNISGTAACGNLGEGIVVSSGASDNVIGGDRFIGSGPLGQGNLISGNQDDGIQIEDSGTSDNQIQGNFIGTDVSGKVELGNLQNGILIAFEASDNVVGGSTAGAGNLISSNELDGISLSDTEGNQIQGNFIGTDISGTEELGNLRIGIVALDASDNLIGGNRFTGSGSLGQGNLVSSNHKDGIRLEDVGTTGNRVQGNFIGTHISGTLALGNWGDGVVLSYGASNNLIGGEVWGLGNLISGNKDQGIHIQNFGTISNYVQGNRVGTDNSGTEALGNIGDGITIMEGASNNFIGGDRVIDSGPLGQGNLISGNGDSGIQIQNEGTTGNYVRGNLIGTNISGTTSLGNLKNGITILDSPSNFIGEAVAGEKNLISGNKGSGIEFRYAGTSGNQVHGNFIGTNVFGTAALGNELNGISIIDGASNNLIGGTMVTAGNTIAFNSDDGIYTRGNQTVHNRISHNSIYDNCGWGIENTDGGNEELGPPTITSIIDDTVYGQAQPSQTIEIFADNAEEGRWFIGNGMTGPDGAFVLTCSDIISAPNLAATATDVAGNTSEFSSIYTLIGSTLTPTSTTVVALCNRTVVCTHTLTNIGVYTDTFTLSATSDRGWLEGYQPSHVILSDGMTVTVIVTVTGPSDLVGREIDRTFITATSGLDQHVLAMAEDITIFDEPIPVGGAMTPTFNTVSVKSCMTVVYTHTLTNNGVCPDTFTFSVTSSQGWLEAYWPPTVTLGSGIAATVNVTITVPDTLTARMKDRTTITATSGLNPQATVTAQNITIFQPPVYLPLVVKN